MRRIVAESDTDLDSIGWRIPVRFLVRGDSRWQTGVFDVARLRVVASTGTFARSTIRRIHHFPGAFEGSPAFNVGEYPGYMVLLGCILGVDTPTMEAAVFGDDARALERQQAGSETTDRGLPEGVVVTPTREVHDLSIGALLDPAIAGG